MRLNGEYVPITMVARFRQVRDHLSTNKDKASFEAAFPEFGEVHASDFEALLGWTTAKPA